MILQIFSIIIVLFFAAVIIWLVVKSRPDWKVPDKPFPEDWRSVLDDHVQFYAQLSDEEKKRFEFKVQEFLLNHRITGIGTEIDMEDRLLVAASAVIPIFGFDQWRYPNVQEILVYPSRFNTEFQTEGEDRNILGMVGSGGYMEGVMILSKSALRHGFENKTDKRNTAIHEFVHLIDKTDGAVDGIPAALMQNQYAIPWIDLMSKEIDRIYEGKSDINPYGATNRQEFFAVTAEYFFERPKLLKQKNPQLYDLLEQIFNQDLAHRNKTKNNNALGPNSPCPCRSGKSFKECCGRVHYS